MNNVEKTKNESKKAKTLELKVLGSRQVVGDEIGETGDLVIRKDGGAPKLLNPADLYKYRDKYQNVIRPSHMALDTWVTVEIDRTVYR